MIQLNIRQNIKQEKEKLSDSVDSSLLDLNVTDISLPEVEEYHAQVTNLRKN
jgi:hypothetical protein